MKEIKEGKIANASIDDQLCIRQFCQKNIFMSLSECDECYEILADTVDIILLPI